MPEWHDPVMVDEVLSYLPHRPDGVYVDGTTGTGGHSSAILSKLGPEGLLICVDQSEEALGAARERLGERGRRAWFHRGSFSELDAPLARLPEPRVDGILLDLGLNSWLLALPSTGLSYQVDAPLTMRLDPDLPETAEGFLARVTAQELEAIFREYGDLSRAPLYARRIVEARGRKRLRSTSDLVTALAGGPHRGIDSAELSRIFQALRVEINAEMERLDRFLERCADWITTGGRLVIISYASHEDRRVKRAFGPKGRDPRFMPLSKHPLAPTAGEVERNRRARSAKLRAFERGGQ